MKKFLGIILAIILIFSVAAVAEPEAVAPWYDVQNDETVLVYLAGDPTNGYEWTINCDEDAINIVETSFVDADNPEDLLGATGYFKALLEGKGKTGRTNVVFTYKQNDAENAAITVEMLIFVNESNQVEVVSCKEVQHLNGWCDLTNNELITATLPTIPNCEWHVATNDDGMNTTFKDVVDENFVAQFEGKGVPGIYVINLVCAPEGKNETVAEEAITVFVNESNQLQVLSFDIEDAFNEWSKIVNNYKLVITLQENASTGYTWQLNYDENAFTLVEEAYELDPEKAELDGAPYTRILSFEGNFEVGEHVIELNSVRAGTEEAIDTHTVKVFVNESNQLQIVEAE